MGRPQLDTGHRDLMIRLKSETFSGHCTKAATQQLSFAQVLVCPEPIDGSREVAQMPVFGLGATPLIEGSSPKVRPETDPAVRFLFARYLCRLHILKLLVRLKNMKSFAPVSLVAHLDTSKPLRDK